MSATGLRNKRLRVSSQNGDAQVYVFQDGTAADAGATVKYDDAFREGAQVSGTTAVADRLYVDLQSYTVSYDTGRELRFEIGGYDLWLTNTSGFQILPNSIVELYADVPDVYTAVPTASWHLNEQTPGTRVRIFYGWVDLVEVSSSGRSVAVTCRDGLWRSKDITVVRSAPDGIDIPRIVFNADGGRDNPDFIYSIKRSDHSGSPAFGIGESDLDDPRMTVEEILTYLADEYETELGNADIITPANGVFDPADLAQLDGIRPDQITLDASGWGDAVLTVLRNWAPDWAIIQDPRTKIFRLIHYAASQSANFTTTTGSTSNTGGMGYTSSVDVTDPSIFSVTPGADGNTVRIFDATNPGTSQILTVATKATNTIGFTTDFDRTYATGAFIYALMGTASPTLTLNVDGAADVNVSLSLEGAYSAVNLVSVHQETTTYSARWAPDTAAQYQELEPAWDAAFEAAWKPEDEWREQDYGISGFGMEVYDIDSSSGNDIIKIKYAESFWGSDHVADEWNGTTLWAWTIDGGTNAKNDGLRFTITDFALTSDVGDGSAGMLITVASTDFVTEVGGSFGTETTPVSGSIDRVAFTQAFEHGSTTVNERWRIGRNWVMSVTGLNYGTNDGISPHFKVCQKLILRAPSDALGSGRSFHADAGHGGYPRRDPGVIRYDGQWAILAEPATPGGFLVGRLAAVTPRPIYGDAPRPAGCGSAGYTPPNLVTADLETQTLTLREARCPTTGHAGAAYTLYGLERVKNVLVGSWDSDNKQADYDALACSLWRLNQDAANRGSVTVHGINEHAAWCDLGIRVDLTSSQIPAGSRALIDSFWGSLTSITFDFAAGSTTYDFTNRSPLAQLGFSALESLRGIKTRTEETGQQLTWIQQMIQCNTNQRVMADPGRIQSCAIEDGGRPLAPGVKLGSPKDNLALRVNPIALDYPDPASGHSTSLGMRASQSVVRDAIGNHFAIGSSGQVIPGSASGSTFVPSTSAATRLHSYLDTTSQTASAATGAAMGGTTAQEIGPVWTTVSAATTTTITTSHAGYNAAEFAGGTIDIVDWDPDNPRASYTISSHTTGGVFTLSGAMSEDVPPAGSLAIIRPAARPSISDSFGTGAGAIKDSSGSWLVVEADGTIQAATVSGGVLNAVGTPESRTMRLGGTPDAATITKITVDAHSTTVLDFSGAAAVILPSGAGSPAEEGEVALNTGTSRFEGFDGAAVQTLATDEMLASTANGKGASLVGIEDSGGYTSETTVEAALAEIYATLRVFSWAYHFSGRIAVDPGTGTIGMADASIVNSTDYDAVLLVTNFADASQRGAAFQFPVPAELDTSVDVSAKLWAYLEGAPTSGHAVEIEWSGRTVGDNEVMASGGATFSGAKVQVVDAHASGDIIVVDLGTFFSGGTLAADDLVKGTIYRNANVGNADDTYTGNFRVSAVQWTGRRKLV